MLVWVAGCDAGPRGTGPLAQDVYVWQRDWKPAVSEAVAARGAAFRRGVVLGAEIGWRGGPQVVEVPFRADPLRSFPAGVGLALRVGSYSGPFRADDAAMAVVRGAATGLVARARAAGLEPVELQVDFDAAESRLDGYRVWAGELKRAVAPVPLTLTALPAWLDRRGFGELVRAVDGYVLQVHSLARPKSAVEPFALCDPVAARRAVERAGRLGVPFRVALPTYGYLLAFGTNGAFLGASAEGPSPARPEGTRYRELAADPRALAHLVADWTRDRPAAMSGLIWYRMPVPGDRWNWRWPTLASVMAGRAPEARLVVSERRDAAAGPGLHEIVLRNDGTADHHGPVRVGAGWSGTAAVGMDGVRGFRVEAAGPEEILFTQPICRLPAGESAIIGWVRLEAETSLRLDVRTSPAGSP